MCVIQYIFLNSAYQTIQDDIHQVFQPHFDGCFRRNDEECSFFTLLIYLSDGFEGGQTTFYPQSNKKVSVDPKVEQAFAFWHRGIWSPYHEGTPHSTEGRYKYVLRSDVMYSVERELSKEEMKLDYLGNPK